MNNSKTLLSSLLKTTQLGQVTIRSILDLGMDPELRETLRSQLREYDTIETEAHSLATQRGWELRELDPAIRILTDMVTRSRLSGRETDTKIAGMMIRGNTNGMISGLKTFRQCCESDTPIRVLSQKLLDCERANIRRMEDFL